MSFTELEKFCWESLQVPLLLPKVHFGYASQTTRAECIWYSSSSERVILTVSPFEHISKENKKTWNVQKLLVHSKAIKKKGMQDFMLIFRWPSSEDFETNMKALHGEDMSQELWHTSHLCRIKRRIKIAFHASNWPQTQSQAAVPEQAHQ